MSLNIVIVGLGQVGSHLAKVLSREKHNVVGIDSDPVCCQQSGESLDIQVFQGQGTDCRVLERAGIREADMLIALTGSDDQNVLLCQMAARYGVRRKIARIRNTAFYENPPLFTLADWGVDVAIQPEEETAKEIVLLIKRSAATDVLEFAQNKVQLIGIRLDAGCPVLNRTVQQVSQQFQEYTFRAVAILRNNRTIVPSGHDLYLQRDQVFFMAETENISKIVELMGKSDEKLRRIMVLGGGKIGRATARLLEKEEDLEIKLIEQDPEKTLRLADELSRTMVIQGDGRSFDLLATEGILETDALVSVTNDQETNILTSLLAKHLGVTKTIALVSREEYLPLMAPIGVNAAVNINLITSNSILRLIRRGEVVSLASLPGVDAQVVEYLVPAGARITRKPLSKIGFPRDAIVGAVMRGDSVLIPVGETRIQAGDHVVVFSLPHALNEVEKFFLP
ncbi:MAG: Trk system potassium transporter TrkA [Candidatus Saccharicenans sp.]|jgi:trk system potassium uptake protein TrkA|nr:Trk system potassium transporter TrkA [Candidatus Saccharicenans sp.]MDH7576155.1 Trk system potassium transporter TrkA [Candidatus Saccharicenans sp.]